MKKLILILITATSFGQVGINTESPTAMIDISGDARIRTIPDGEPTDSILLTNNGFIRKISLSDLIPGNCPSLIEKNGYYLKFESSESIPSPNQSLVISGLNFVSAGTWIENNKYYFTYSNTSGTPLNTSSFTVNFNGLNCQY